MGTILPLKRAETTFHMLPTLSGFWITLFVAVTNATAFSNEVPATSKDAALRCNASPIPEDVIASLFDHSVTSV